MDIVRSLELDSCILSKLTKPSVPVNLVVSHAEGSMTVRRFTGSSTVAREEQQVWVSRGMARPVMGVRWGGEACAAIQPATGRREQAVPPAPV